MYLRAVRRHGGVLEDAELFDRAAELYEKSLEAEPLAKELYRRLIPEMQEKTPLHARDGSFPGNRGAVPAA